MNLSPIKNKMCKLEPPFEFNVMAEQSFMEA